MSTTPTLTVLTNQGLIVSQLEDRLAQLAAGWQSVFGLDINLDTNSLDGQIQGILGASYNDLDQLVEAVYQSFNPNSATGAALSLLVQLNGIKRNLGSYSTVVLTCTGTAGSDIPLGAFVAPEDNSTTWVTTLDVTIPASGLVQVTAQSTVIGPVKAPAGTLTVISSPVYGWQTVTNLSDATIGASQETDAALRVRRASSTASSGQSIIESIYAAVADLTGVVEAAAYENKTDSSAVSVDNPHGLPPHSINVVVLGGVPADIAQAIWVKASAGATLTGAQVQQITDIMGNPHNVYYDIPTPVLIYITVNGKKRIGYPSNGAALIQSAIAAWATVNQTIGIDVVQSELYTPINSVPGVSVSSVLIGTAPNSTSTADVPITYNAIASILSGNIVVNIN